MTPSVDPSDRSELWEALETVATRSQTGLHVPIKKGDEIAPLCGRSDGGRGPTGDWLSKPRATYPGREEDLCDLCLQSWVNSGKPDPELIDLPLSSRQHQALVTAYQMGYFEWPRDAEMNDVADEIGLEQSTVSEHLRRASQILLETIPLEEVATLTDRQRQVLATAKEMGVYESPRKSTYEDLSVELGISEATLNQHLRVAWRKLVAASVIAATTDS